MTLPSVAVPERSNVGAKTKGPSSRLTILAAIVMACAAPLVAPMPPMQDEAEWMWQCAIAAHQLPASRWSWHFTLVPNLGFILPCAALAHVLPIAWAAKLAIVLSIIVLSLGMYRLALIAGHGMSALPFALLLGYFTWMGNMAYLLSLGLALFAIAEGERGLSSDKPRPANLVRTLALSGLAWLAHGIGGLTVLSWALLAVYEARLRSRPQAVFGALMAGWISGLFALSIILAGSSAGVSAKPAYVGTINYKIASIAAPWFPIVIPLGLSAETVGMATVLAGVSGVLFVLLFARRTFAARHDLAGTRLGRFAIAMLVGGAVFPTALGDLVRPDQRLLFVGILATGLVSGEPATSALERLAIPVLVATSAAFFVLGGVELQQRYRELEKYRGQLLQGPVVFEQDPPSRATRLQRLEASVEAIPRLAFYWYVDEGGDPLDTFRTTGIKLTSGATSAQPPLWKVRLVPSLLVTRCSAGDHR